MSNTVKYGEGHQGPDRRTTHWVFDKRITAGHILTTLLALTSAGMVIYHMDQRITQNSYAIQKNEQRISFVDKSNSDERERVASELEKLNDKLDKIFSLMLDDARNGKK